MSDDLKQKIEHGLDTGELIMINGIPVCSFCNGNCGQCGLTSLIGNVPFSMDAIISNFNKPKRRFFGLLNFFKRRK